MSLSSADRKQRQEELVSFLRGIAYSIAAADPESIEGQVSIDRGEVETWRGDGIKTFLPSAGLAMTAEIKWTQMLVPPPKLPWYRRVWEVIKCMDVWNWPPPGGGPDPLRDEKDGFP